MNSHWTGAFVEYTLVVVPLITLIFWCLVHHDSIAVSKSLLLLLAVELEATELALARMSLSLFPKTSFTATQMELLKCYSLRGKRSTARTAWWAPWNGNSNLLWFQSSCPYPKYRVEAKGHKIACLWYFNCKSCYFSSRASRGFLCIIPAPKYCKIDEVWRPHH